MTTAPQTFSAWADSLPADEQYWACVPRGVMVTYWMVAICKYLLQQKMSAGERLRASEMLDHQSQVLDAEAIAAIQPAGPAELEIFAATAKASPTTDDKDRRGERTFDILGGGRVFDLLVQANPSVLDAIKSSVARQKAGAVSAHAPANQQTTAAGPAGQPRYGVHDVPTVLGGPASNYTNPEPYWNRPERERQQFVEGSPNNKPINPFTGR
jgi:hypothetical protein